MRKPLNLEIELDALVVDTFQPQPETTLAAIYEPMAAIDPLGKAETGCVSGCGGSICG